MKRNGASSDAKATQVRGRRPHRAGHVGHAELDRLRSRVRDHSYAVGALSGLARRLGGSFVGLDIAEPDLPTPRPVVRAMVRALRERPEATHYTRIRALPEFAEAVSAYLAREFGVPVDPETQVLATVGSGEGLYITFSAIVEPGDELLLPNPTFSNYAAILQLLGGRPRFVPTDERFHLDLGAVEAGVGRRTKAIVLCHPNNPTGAVYEARELEGILGIAERHRLLVLSDENYAPLVYDGRPFRSFAALSGAAERTILVSGLSKAHAMTGWRLGYVVAAPELSDQFEKVAFEIRGSVNTAVQWAGAAALGLPRSYLDGVRRHYDAHRHLVVNGLREAGLDVPLPEAGFEVFPRVPNGFADGSAWTEHLARTARVLVKPGAYFGPAGRDRVRLVYSVSRPTREEALSRLGRALGGARAPGSGPRRAPPRRESRSSRAAGRTAAGRAPTGTV